MWSKKWKNLFLQVSFLNCTKWTECYSSRLLCSWWLVFGFQIHFLISYFEYTSTSFLLTVLNLFASHICRTALVDKLASTFETGLYCIALKRSSSWILVSQPTGFFINTSESDDLSMFHSHLISHTPRQPSRDPVQFKIPLLIWPGSKKMCKVGYHKTFNHSIKSRKNPNNNILYLMLSTRICLGFCP